MTKRKSPPSNKKKTTSDGSTRRKTRNDSLCEEERNQDEVIPEIITTANSYNGTAVGGDGMDGNSTTVSTLGTSTESTTNGTNTRRNAEEQAILEENHVGEHNGISEDGARELEDGGAPSQQRNMGAVGNTNARAGSVGGESTTASHCRRNNGNGAESVAGTTTFHVSETVTAPPKVREALRGILPPELVNVSDATKDLIDQFVEHIKAVVGTNSGLVKTIQEINSENAKLQRKKNPRQALHNLDRTIVRAVENALRDKVWRKSYFLKETWEVYSDEITSFCYLFIGWAKLGDYHPERFGGMKVLWSFFVVPLIDMCLRSWRNNTLKRLSTVWKSMCNHFDIMT